MNAYSLLQAHLALDLATLRSAELRSEADEYRRARLLPRTTRPAAIARMARSIRGALVRPVGKPGGVAPRLTDYPYRG